MDIMTIKCFISVARCLNFTRAAEECHISQTAMSKKISSLESELETTLFFRDNRQVQLTPAGYEFLHRANTLLEVYQDAVLHTKNVANGYESSLKIGIGVYEHLLLHDTLEQYLAVYPHADISFSQFSYKVLAEYLNDRLLDIIISTDQYLYRIPDTEYRIIRDTPWKFVCGSKHPLAQKDQISLEELSDWNFITMNDGTHEQIRRSYISSGFGPKRFFRVNSYNTKILMTRANLGISTMPDFMMPYLPKDLHVLNVVPDYRPRRFVAAWLIDNNNPAVKNFIDILTAEIEKDGTINPPPRQYPSVVYRVNHPLQFAASAA